MTTSPLMAFWRLIRDARTTEVRRLNLISSCLNTVFIDSLYNTGYFFMTCSLQKNIFETKCMLPFWTVVHQMHYIYQIAVVPGEMCTYKFQIVVLWQFSKDICSQILDDIGCGFASLTGLARKGQQNVVKQLKLWRRKSLKTCTDERHLKNTFTTRICFSRFFIFLDQLPLISNTVFTSWVSWLSFVISAFSWRPKTSGRGLMGRVLM